MPLLNGHQYDWPSIDIILPSIGVFPVSTQSISHPMHGIEAPDVYGSGTKPIGYTRGQYKIENLEIEFLVGEWDYIRAILGAGYLETASLPIVFTYTGLGLIPRKDEFIDCKIINEQQVVTQGTDPVKVKVTFKPTEMVLNGVPATLPRKI